MSETMTNWTGWDEEMQKASDKEIIKTLVDALEWSVRLMEAMGQSAHRETLNKARDALALAADAAKEE